MANKIYLNSTFAYREDTLKNWQTANPVLEKGEISFVRDGFDGKFIKIGDGHTSWNSLPFAPLPKGEKGEDGIDGKDGADYVLTRSDKEEIADMAKIIVDQSYSPISENPQSGKAVAEAVTEKWELLHDVVVDTEVAALNLDVYSKKVHLEAVLKKPANYTSGSVSIYFQPGSYRGAMMAAAYSSTNGLMAVQGDMHIEPSGRITTMLGVEQGEYGYSSAHRRSIVTQNFATNGKISKVQLQASAFGVGSIIKVWGVK